MAKKGPIKILRESPESWNQWRYENKDIRLNKFSKADLSKTNLRGVNLSKTNLRRVTFSGADLSKANLNKTNLRYVNLRNASLAEADLGGADLSGANLINAQIWGANLRRTNISGAYLKEANLSGADLRGADLSGANLRKADLHEANLCKADIRGADLRRADLHEANLCKADIRGADLRRTNLREANLCEVNLSEADIRGADLSFSTVVKSKLQNAKMTNCRIYGISAWDIEFNTKTKQQDLIITPEGKSAITVDNLEVAQFVYLLINNEKIRDVIDTIGKKGVLILGRFTGDRIAVLNAIRNKLRDFNYVPMLFDFKKPTQRDFTETIKILAGLSRFIIADVTNPKSNPLELQALMPDYMIPFVPICADNEKPFSMFQDLQNKYSSWMLDLLEYDSTDNLIDVIEDGIIKPALKMAEQLELKKAEETRKRHVANYKRKS